MSEIAKKCRYCGKEYIDLASHVINKHPTVLEKIEEGMEFLPNQTPILAQTQPVYTPKAGDINSMIREKLDTMLNIKIIEMLSSNPNVTIQELNEQINPRKETSLDELQKFHEMVYPKEKDLLYVETENQWVNIVQQAMPVIKDWGIDLLKNRTNEGLKNGNTNTGLNESENTITGISEINRNEITGITEQPKNIEPESKNDNGNSEQSSTEPKQNN